MLVVLPAYLLHFVLLLKDKGYPGEPNGDFYLVFDIEQASEFDGYSWDFTKLPNRLGGRQSAAPFVVTLDAVLAAANS